MLNVLYYGTFSALNGVCGVRRARDISVVIGGRPSGSVRA